MNLPEKSILDLGGYFPKPKKSLTIEEINHIIMTKNEDSSTLILKIFRETKSSQRL